MKAIAPAIVFGIGAVTPLGRDLSQIARALSQPSSKSNDPRRVADEYLADPILGKKMRRADRFARMATIAASDAWNNAKPSLANVPMDRIGLIVTSGFGPHNRGFKFIDGILDCGDSAALPTDFSHSVHGAAAAYITELLQLRGPSLSTTDFEMGIEQAILLAQCWLNESACDRVLVGAVEELGEVLLHCAQRILGDSATPGEGAVFMMLGKADSGGIAKLDASDASSGEGAHIVETLESHFGTIASPTGFQLLAAILSMQENRAVDNVVTSRPLFNSTSASVRLTRS